MIAVALAGLFAFTSPASAKPQAGDLDRSFSGDGLAQTVFPGYMGYSIASAVAVDHEGRIVAAGENGTRFALARYEPNGRLDHSFAGDGRLLTPFGDGHAFGRAVAIGRHGSIVVAGGVCPSRCEFAVARYEADGRLDRSFGDDGTVTIDSPGSSSAYATGVAFGPKGRVLVTGSIGFAHSGYGFALARLDRNGELDPSFGTTGRVTTRFEDGAGDRVSTLARAMAIDSRGRIVLGGDAESVAGALARYKPNGALDRSFSHDGKAIKRLSRLDQIAALAVDSKDRIVAAGDDRGESFSGASWALARFRKHGRLDSSFGRDGQVSTVAPAASRPASAAANALAIDSRNRIVVAGRPDFALVRYRPSGHKDKSFGEDGKVWEDIDYGSANALAIDSKDRPVVAGEAMSHQETPRVQFAVARFLG